MLDSAIRQSASTNIGRPDPPPSGIAPSASGTTAVQALNTAAAVMSPTDIAFDGDVGGAGDGAVADKRGGTGIDADVVGTEGREVGGEGDGGAVGGGTGVGTVSGSSAGAGDPGENDAVSGSRLEKRELQPAGDASPSREVCVGVLADDRRNVGVAVDVSEGDDASGGGGGGSVDDAGGAPGSGSSIGIGHATDAVGDAAATSATSVAVGGDDGMGQAVTADIGDLVTADVESGGNAGSVVVDENARTADTTSGDAVAESDTGADDYRLGASAVAKVDADVTARNDSARLNEGLNGAAVISSGTNADDGVISGKGRDGFVAEVKVDKLTSQHRQ